MEDQDVASAEGVVAPPFSELIRDWLDEGDRLDEKAVATAAASPPATEGRLHRIAQRLRPAFGRYRVFVLAALGLIPFALFALTHHGAAVPTLAVATLSNVALPPPAGISAPESVGASPSPAAAPSTRHVVSAARPAAISKPHHRASHHAKHRPVARRGRRA